MDKKTNLYSPLAFPPDANMCCANRAQFPCHSTVLLLPALAAHGGLEWTERDTNPASSAPANDAVTVLPQCFNADCREQENIWSDQVHDAKIL